MAVVTSNVSNFTRQYNYINGYSNHPTNFLFVDSQETGNLLILLYDVFILCVCKQVFTKNHQNH